jgi:V-type H+-transporting ATPase subunit A
MNFRAGDLISGGDILGNIKENSLFHDHKVLASPHSSGRVVEMQPAGEYTVSQAVCTIEKLDGTKEDLNLSHFWPVRKPRPVIEKLPASEPLLTGQRVLDSLYPSVLGGTCAIPGAFGCGKTCISQALSKYSNS